MIKLSKFDRGPTLWALLAAEAPRLKSRHASHYYTDPLALGKYSQVAGDELPAHIRGQSGAPKGTSTQGSLTMPGPKYITCC